MNRALRASLTSAASAVTLATAAVLIVGVLTTPAHAQPSSATPAHSAANFASVTAAADCTTYPRCLPRRVNFKGVRFREKRTVINLDRGHRRRQMINREHQLRGLPQLPYCAKRYIIRRNGAAIVKGIANRCLTATRPASSFTTAQARSLTDGYRVAGRGFWGSWGKAVKCAAAITVAVGSLVFAWAKLLKAKKYIRALNGLVKELGGKRKTAQKVMEALKKKGTTRDKARYLANAAGPAAQEFGQALVAVAVIILDLDQIKEHCL